MNRNRKRSHLAKLTPGQIRQIRKLYSTDVTVTQGALADRFGVSQPTISMILRGMTYRKVE